MKKYLSVDIHRMRDGKSLQKVLLFLMTYSTRLALVALLCIGILTLATRGNVEPPPWP